jgi:O-antigen ligase/polysaccharide polymerase Wzy-like membrane protein
MKSGILLTPKETWLPFCLIQALFLATLTLWVPAYWPVAAFEIAVYLIAGGGVVAGNQPLKGAAYPLAVLIFIVLWGSLQLLIGSSVSSFVTERAIAQWMTWAAVYYVGVSTLKEQNLARLVRVAMVWFGFVVAVEAILQAYLSPGKVFGLFDTGYQNFVMGPIVYHTHFAAFIEAILPIALLLAFESYTYLGIAAVLLTSVVVSASRGGMLITSVEVLVVLLLSHRQKQKILRSALTLAGVTALLMLIVGLATASQRFHGEALAVGRVQFARSTLHMIAVHPLIGWGLGCWPMVYPAFATFDPGALVNQAHTDWLQWTAEGGLPVGLAMLSLAVWAVKPAIRSIWGIGVIAVLVHATFDYPFSRPAVGAWPFLILAMAVVESA